MSIWDDNEADEEVARLFFAFLIPIQLFFLTLNCPTLAIAVVDDV